MAILTNNSSSNPSLATMRPIQSNLYQHHSKELKLRLLYILCTWTVAFATAFYNMEFLLYKLLLTTKTENKSTLSTQLTTPTSTNTEMASVGAHFSKTTFANPITENTTNYTDFIFTEIFEAFFSYLVVSGYVAFIVSLPIIYYHVYQFLLPGLSFTESSLLKVLFYLSLFFFCVAHLLTYFVLIPYATNFLLAFQSSATYVQSSSHLGITPSSVDISYGDERSLTTLLTPNLTFLGRVYPWITFTINLFTAVSTLFHLPLFLFVIFLYFKGLNYTPKVTMKSGVTDFVDKPTALHTVNLRKAEPNGDINESDKNTAEANHRRSRREHLHGYNLVDTSFFRKLLFFMLVVLTALFSPPDLYSQIFLLVPLFFIIELFLFAVFLYTEYVNLASSTSSTSYTAFRRKDTSPSGIPRN